MARSPFVVAPSLALTAAPTSVAAGDVNGDGRLDLVITKKGSGSVTVLLGNGQGGFAPAVDYPAGKLAGNAVLADLNGDGHLDVAVTDGITGAVDVLIGNGDGTLGAPVSYAVQSSPAALAVGNFAGRGKIDLAVAGASGLSVLLNDGTGHFSAATTVPLSSHTLSLTASDLRHTGHDDLVLANQDGTVSVLLNNGAGGFGSPASLSVASGPLSAVVTGDFNGDGKADLAVSASASNTIDVLLGHGDGSFAPGVAYSVGNSPASLIAADLRGTGVTDLVSVNQAANTFSVLLGNGDGTFHPSADFVAGNSPIAVAAGDFNGDGHADLAIANYTLASVNVPLGRGDGTFSASRVYRAGLERKAIAAGDLNGDGRSDLVVTNFCGSDASCTSNGSATVFLAQMDGTYKAAGSLTLGNGPVAAALADLNGDKKLDLVVLNQIDKSLMVLPGQGDGTFGTPQLYSLPASPRALFVGDLSGDGVPDVAIASDCGQSACSQPGSLDIWLGHSDGSLAASASYTVGYAPVSIAAGDLRGTGHLDLVVASSCGDSGACTGDGTGAIFANDGTGKFTQMGEVDLGSSPSSIALGNLSGSGLDLAVAQSGSNQIAVLHGNGAGGFGAPVTYAAGKAPSAIAIADLNGDGLPDVAVANFQSSTVSVLYGTASGALASATTYPVSAGPDALVALSPTHGNLSTIITTNGDTGATPMGNGITAMSGTGGTTASTTTFTSTANTAAVDAQVTISGNVAPTSGSGATPTGNLVFAIDASGTGAGPFTYLADCGGGAGVQLSGGNATCTTQLLPAGTDNIQLQYFGDSTYATSVSSSPAEQAQTISKANTAVTVSPTTAATLGQQVTLTATVVPSPTPTNTTNDALTFPGTMAFSSGGTGITGCGTLTVINIAASESAIATCTTSSLPVGGNSITATYSGDANYNANTSTAVTQTINQATTTTTVAASPSANVALNTVVSFTATLNLPSGATTTPTGSITLTDNGGSTPICTQPLPASAPYQVTCAPSSLKAGTHAIVAAYTTGDSNYSSSSGSLTETVIDSSSTVTVGSSSSTSSVNQSVTFTVTVTPNGITLPNAGVVQLSGTVALTDGVGGPPVPGCTVSFVTSTGVATCSTSSLSIGSHTIVASYSADSNYPAGATAQLTQTVNALGTTTALSASPSTTTSVGQSVTFTATVTPSGALVPTGTVNFQNGGVTITGCGRVGISSTGPYQATCTTTFTAVGSNSITAAYSGDSNYTSSSGGATQTVNQGGTTTTLASSLNPSNVGQQVVLTAMIAVPSGATVAPTGTVTITGCGSVSISSSAPYVASCTTTFANFGSNTLTATYSGDSNYTSSTSGNVTQTVDQAATSVVVTASPSTPALNQPVTFTATVTIPAGATTAPTGTVSFTDDNAPITACGTNGVVTITASTAPFAVTCSVSSLTAAGHTVVAAYSGDTNYSSSFGKVGISLNGISTTTTISAAPNPSNVNQAVTFTVNVQGSTTVQLTGTATVVADGTNNLGQCAPTWNSSTGLATCTVSNATLSKGTHSITASYSGDANYNSSSTGTPVLQQTVNADTTSLTLSASPTPSSVNQTVTLTATIAFTSGSTPITGTVAFTDNTVSIAGCSAVAPSSTGVAVCTDTALTAAGSPHTIAASYTGDSNFGGSSATPSLAQTVSKAATSLALSTSSASVQVNAPVTFTATLTYPAGGVPLTGSVAFTDSVTSAAIPNCSAQALAINGSTGTAIATCTTSTLAFGTHSITAAYTDSANNFSPITSSSISQGVGTAPITMNMSATATSGVVNQATPIAFSAVITAPSGTTSLTGKVAFTDNGTTIGTCSAVSPSADGTSGGNSLWLAACSDSALTAAGSPHTIAASYTGDTNFGNQNATFGTKITITPAAAPIAVVAAPNPSSFNQSVTFTATVSAPAGGVALSGTVSFTDTPSGGLATAIKNCTGITPSANGVATCSYSALAIGSHTITATYSGDPNFSSSPNTVTQTVGATATTTTLTANPTTATFNTPVVFTATVSSAAQNGTAFSGSMAFTSNGSTITNCGAVAVDPTSGIALCPTSILPAGADTIIATYSSDPRFSTSTASLIETVAAASATIVLTPTAPAPILAVNPNGTNDSVTFTASIVPAYSGSVPLSGTMVFTDTITSNGTTSSAPICKVAPSASGVASCACPSASCVLPSGQNTITAAYTGDPNLAPAPSAAVSQLVEDYSLVVSSAPPVAVTQGFTTSNDLFSAQTISVSPVSISGFTTASGQPLSLKCAVTAVAPATGATAPACTLAGSTVAVATSGTPEPTVGIVIDATKATAGAYSVTLNATDPTTGLTHASTPFSVIVRGVAGPLTLVSGATTGNTATVSFLLPAGVSLSKIACADVAGPNLSSPVAPSSLSIGCNFNPTTIAASASQQNGTTTVTVSTTGTTAAVAGHTNFLFAGLLGIPLFGLFGLLRGRRSFCANLLRLIAIAAIGFAAFQTMGCGGSFQRSTTTGGGQTPPGAYDLLITGTGSDGNAYQAVLSLNVTL